MLVCTVLWKFLQSHIHEIKARALAPHPEEETPLREFTDRWEIDVYRDLFGLIGVFCRQDTWSRKRDPVAGQVSCWRSMGKPQVMRRKHSALQRKHNDFMRLL